MNRSNMEWETLPAGSQWDSGAKIIHSTPLTSRPAPTFPPNVSAITTADADISELAGRFAELTLD